MNYGSHTNGAYPMSFDQTEINDGKQKRRRGNLPKHVTDILRRWFHDHIGHPYPTEEEKHNLMTETGLSMSQVRVQELLYPPDQTRH